MKMRTCAETKGHVYIVFDCDWNVLYRGSSCVVARLVATVMAGSIH